MIAFSMLMLPEVFDTISSASTMGTPEATIVPRVRVKRATAAFRTSGPKRGVLRMYLSKKARVGGKRMNQVAKTAAANIPPAMKRK